MDVIDSEKATQLSNTLRKAARAMSSGIVTVEVDVCQQREGGIGRASQYGEALT